MSRLHWMSLRCSRRPRAGSKTIARLFARSITWTTTSLKAPWKPQRIRNTESLLFDTKKPARIQIRAGFLISSLRNNSYPGRNTGAIWSCHGHSGILKLAHSYRRAIPACHFQAERRSDRRLHWRSYRIFHIHMLPLALLFYLSVILIRTDCKNISQWCAGAYSLHRPDAQ